MTEHSRILDMLSEGKISVDEAERLLTLTARPVASRATADPRVEPGRPQIERVTVTVDSDDAAAQAGSRDDGFAVGPSPTLIVASHNGRVVVRAGDDGAIRVQAKLKSPSRVDYRVGQQGDVVTVDARQKGKSSWFGLWGLGSGADIDVTAPKNTKVELKTSNAGVELRGLDAGGTLDSSNGRIVIDGADGEYHAATSNGRIELRAMKGSATLRTSNGSIEMSDVQGEFNAETSNGAIHFDGELSPGGKNRFTTSNGSVKVSLAGTPSLEIDASTSNSKISTTIPSLTRPQEKKNRLVGTIGDGEAELFIRTSNGSVTIE